MSAGVVWEWDFTKKKKKKNLKANRKHQIRYALRTLGTLSYANVTNSGSFTETNARAPGVSAGHIT